MDEPKKLRDPESGSSPAEQSIIEAASPPPVPPGVKARVAARLLERIAEDDGGSDGDAGANQSGTG